MGTRDAGGRDFDDLVVTPGANIRSRVVESEALGQSTELVEAAPGEWTCPTCGIRLPDLAVACPDDGTGAP